MATITRDRKCDHGGKRCQCNWLVRYRDADGRSREKSFPWDRKTIAADFMKKAEGDRVQGIRPVTSSATFGEYAEKCIRQRTGTDSTKRRYMSVLKLHLGMLAGRKLVMVAQDKAGIRTLLLETLPAKGLSHSQIEIAHVIIVSTVIRAVDDGEIPGHNLGRIRLPADPDGESIDPELVEAGTNAAIRALADGMPDRWALAIWLARGCGLRISEALAVKITDFSEDMTWLTLARQRTSGSSTSQLKSRKPREARHIPVPLYVAEFVRDHVAQHGTKNGFLFSGERSLLVPSSSFDRAFKPARDAAGLPGNFTFHTIRHVYATRMIDSGIDSADVSGWLGHRDINLTRRVYTHWLPKTADRAREFLDAEWAN